jgi:hypothetical protein
MFESWIYPGARHDTCAIAGADPGLIGLDDGFDRLSAQPDTGNFADGVVEDIITALSRLRPLCVIARNSSFAYKGRNIDLKLRDPLQRRHVEAA